MAHLLSPHLKVSRWQALPGEYRGLGRGQLRGGGRTKAFADVLTRWLVYTFQVRETISLGAGPLDKFLGGHSCIHEHCMACYLKVHA